MGLRLRLHPALHAVCRLDPGSAVPAWAEAGDFRLACRTTAELTLIVEESSVPAGIRAERGYRLVEFVGPFPFTAVGILAAVAGPLATAGIPILATSTYDTDYVLFPETLRERAVAALAAAGHAIDGTAK